MSWLPGLAEGDSLFARVFGLRPALFAAWVDFASLVWTQALAPPVLLECSRLRLVTLLGARSAQRARMSEARDAGLDEAKIAALAHWRSSPHFGPAERAALDFTEQFAADAAGISDGQAARLRAELGDAGLVAFVQALAVFDGFGRFAEIFGIVPADAADAPAPRAIGAAAFRSAPSPTPRVAPPPGAAGDDPIRNSALAHQPELLARFLRLYGVLWSETVLGQALLETARLRNARRVGCPICKAVRFAGARAEGLSEEQVALITDDHAQSALPTPHKAVLRWTDAFLDNPGGEHRALHAEMLRHFAPPQIVELGVGNALFLGFSKVALALGGLPEEIPVFELPSPAVPDADQ